MDLGILQEDGAVVEVTCFNSSMNLEELIETETENSMEARILQTYDGKNVRATYFEKDPSNQKIVENLQISPNS